MSAHWEIPAPGLPSPCTDPCQAFCPRPTSPSHSEHQNRSVTSLRKPIPHILLTPITTSEVSCPCLPGCHGVSPQQVRWSCRREGPYAGRPATLGPWSCHYTLGISENFSWSWGRVVSAGLPGSPKEWVPTLSNILQTGAQNVVTQSTLEKESVSKAHICAGPPRNCIQRQSMGFRGGGEDPQKDWPHKKDLRMTGPC